MSYLMLLFCFFFFFFKQKTAYEMLISDWSSDVCSSDLSGCGLRRPPNSGIATYSMPADASIGAITSGENCGLLREPAKRRPSARTSMPTSPSMPANTSHSRVECPTVQRVPRDWDIAASCRNHRAGRYPQAWASPQSGPASLQHSLTHTPRDGSTTHRPASTSMPTAPSMPANTAHSRVEGPTVQGVPRDWVIAASCGNHRAGSVSQAGATPPTVLDPLQHRIDPGVGDVAPTCGASIERLSRAQADHPAATRRRLVIAAIAVVDPHRTDVLPVEQVRQPRISPPLQSEGLEAALGGQVEYRVARSAFIGTVVHVHAVAEAPVEDDEIGRASCRERVRQYV